MRPPDSYYNLFFYSISVFIQLSVGTYYGVIAGIGIPTFFFFNFFPLSYCADISNVRQFAATVKGINAYFSYAKIAKSFFFINCLNLLYD